MTEADGGNLSRAADLTLAAITEDGLIAGIVKTISHGIPRLPHRFVGPPELVTALEGTADKRGMFGDICPEAELAKILEWGIVLGVGPMQRIRCESRGAWGEPRVTFRVRAWHPRWFRYDHSRDDWQITVRGDGMVNGLLWLSEHRDEFSLFMPHGSSKPWELAHWKYVVKGYLMRRDAEYDRARHSAMNGPILVGIGGHGYSAKNMADYEAVMADMERRARIVLPYGGDLKTVAPPAGDLSGVYGQIGDYSAEDIEIGLLGNTVMTGGKTGSMGSTGEAWERMTQSRIDFYASSLERFAQNEILDPWSIDCAGEPIVGILYDTRAPSQKATDDSVGTIAAPQQIQTSGRMAA